MRAPSRRPLGEAAELSDCPGGTVRSRMARARAAFIASPGEAERREPVPFAA